jgi:hypothetical protein
MIASRALQKALSAGVMDLLAAGEQLSLFDTARPGSHRVLLTAPATPA